VESLTPGERRGALVVVFILARGAGHDVWRALGPRLGAPEGAVPSEPAPAADRGLQGAGPSGARLPRDARGVEINRASATDLEALPGIGPVLARRIVAHREAHGPFHRPEELLAVRGIGPRLFERLQPYLVIDPRPASPRSPPPDTTADAGRATSRGR